MFISNYVTGHILLLILLSLIWTVFSVNGVSEESIVGETEDELPKPRRGVKEQREPEKNRVGERCEAPGTAGKGTQFQDASEFYASMKGRKELKQKERAGGELCQSRNCRFNYQTSMFVCVEANFSEMDDGNGAFMNPYGDGQQGPPRKRPVRGRNARPQKKNGACSNINPLVYVHIPILLILYETSC